MPKISKVPSSARSTPEPPAARPTRETRAQFPLAEHQSSGVARIQSSAHGLLLADEPGLGKSRTAIKSFDGGRVLIVAPSMVINGGTWEDELELWADYPSKFTVAPYSMLNARKDNRPLNALRDEFKGTWDAIIVDEAHYTKGRKTSWTWAVQQIAKSAGTVLPMTGTPIPNWAYECYTLLQMLYPEDAKPKHRFGAYMGRWVPEWFELSPNRFNPQAQVIGGLKRCTFACMQRPKGDPCEHWDQFTAENFGDKFLRRLRDDVLDLPPLTEQQVLTPMDASAARMYRDLKREYLTNTDDGEEVVAWTSGARNVMLDRLTTSPWFLDPKGEPSGGKLERLRFDLEGRSAPTLVVAHYRDSVEAAARVAQSVGAKVSIAHGGVADAGRAAKDFKEGKTDVLVGSLELVAEGLTFTNADQVIFLEKSYKPSRNEQALRRVHRMGQTRPVTALDYVTPDSVDFNKRKLLELKTDQQMQMMSAAMFGRLL